MIKILVISDDGVSSGYGRISAELNRNLVKRGYKIMAASLQYDGLLPASYDGEILPYHVASLQGKPNWPDCVASLVNAYQPDMVMVIQDAPFSQTVRNMPLDWSKYAFVMLSPVDGAPIYPAWVETAKTADGLLTISEFGVNAWKEAGVQAGLVRPGINPNKFFKVPAGGKENIRKALGIKEDAFVLGTMCMNQGRKSISLMVKAFFDFAKDKPDARYLLDMDEMSLAGWDIPALCSQYGWDKSKLIFRSDAIKAGVTELRDRYNALDAHMVLAHREGFGLPLAEAQACGVVSIALDYCSGTEVCGNGNGVLIKPLDLHVPGTWGGAEDWYPDMNDLAQKLQWLYDNPLEREAIAQRGMKEARQHTWDRAVDNAVAVIEKAIEKRKKSVAAPLPEPSHDIIKSIEPLPQSPDGVTQQVALVEG